MLRTCFTLLLFLPLHLVAQELNNIDSIQRLLRVDSNNTSALLALAQIKQTSTDTDYFLSQKVVDIAIKRGNFQDLALAYNRIGVLYFFSSFYDTALIYFRKTYTISARHNLHFIAAKSLTNIGQIHVVEDQLRKAIDTLRLAQYHLSKEKNINLQREQRVKSEYLLGETYSQIGLYPEAIELFLTLNQLYDKSPDLKGRGNILNGLGNLYLFLDNYPKSVHYFLNALNFYRREKDVTNEQKALYNLGHAYFVKGDLDSSLLWYNTAIKKYIELKDDTQLPFLYELRANIFRSNNQIDSALIYYNSAIALYSNIGATGRVGECYYEIGNMYFNTSSFRKAISFYEKAVLLFRENDLIEQEKNTLLLLANTEEKTGNYHKSVQHFKQYDSLKNAIITTEKTNAITRQEIKYETSLKEAHIAQQHAEIKLRTTQNDWLIRGITGVTLASLGVGLSYIRIRKQKRIITQQKKEILHNNRNNIQQLISIFGRQGEADGYKDKAAANQERLVTVNLLNKLLYDVKNENSISVKTYLEKMREVKHAAYEVPISLAVIPSSLAVKSSLLVSIGLIVNELTTNAAKYAFSDLKQAQITLEVVYMNDKIRIFCRDNGKGLPVNFDILAEKQSFGLSFVYDLVDQHHGNIKAFNDGGACFEIYLKCKGYV